MPSYKMQYVDDNGKELDKPIKVLIHKTQAPEAGGHDDLPADASAESAESAESVQQDAELLSYFNAQAFTEKPNVSDLKADFAWLTKSRRDALWGHYINKKESI